MGELSSKFTRDDVETLIEAMNDWESLGNQEYHILQMIKNAPMPPDDHEAHEAMNQIKEHFRRREKDIMRSRDVRQERAVFLKAKLLLVRKDLGLSQLFEMATEPGEPAIDAKVAQKTFTEGGVDAPVTTGGPDEVRTKLELAEFFIRDLGVWTHYQNFLKEKNGQ